MNGGERGGGEVEQNCKDPYHYKYFYRRSDIIDVNHLYRLFWTNRVK